MVTLFSQEVYQHISNEAIYNFLDEMASEQLIEVNTAVRPWTRHYIAERLDELNGKKNLLNNRQQTELDFYLKDYNKELKNGKYPDKRFDLFYRKDSLFTISINPILGIQYWKNDSGQVYHRWNGAEAFAYIGSHWGLYANLRDNHESLRLSAPSFLNQRQGANYKETGKGGDYSEMRGGITYSVKWGSIGLVKDHFEWGNNYNGANIFSGKQPSFAAIKIHLNPVKWFELNYFHGWLVSNLIDSAESYTFTNGYGTSRRDVMHTKYLAANFVTFTPLKELQLSMGNSIIYSDIGVQPAYLIPFLFYKSVDHALDATDHVGQNIGQNSQMFFDISSRQIKHIHLYGTFFFDELSTENLTNPSKQSNFFSYKGGICASNFVVNNVIVIAEYTRTNPLAFQHDIPTTTFESNGYNMGHYLKDNAQEIFLSLRVNPAKNFNIVMNYSKAERGKDYTKLGGSRLGLPFMDTVEWTNTSYDIRITYQPLNDVFVFMEYTDSNIISAIKEYTPGFFQGHQKTLSIGINYGF
jgi:hypothetical protein